MSETPRSEEELDWYDTFDPVEDALKALTLLDWVDPMYDLGLALFADLDPVFVLHQYRFEATAVLGVQPHTYNVLFDCWIYMVDDLTEAHHLLESADIPLVVRGDEYGKDW